MSGRREPIWIERLVLDAVHFDQIREHGGLSGVRDENSLESALARPRHRWLYSRRTEIPAIAAAYAYGITRNHPFRDGDKRTGFLAMYIFLGLNGYELVAPETEVVAVMVSVAAAKMTESTLIRWVKAHSGRWKER